MSQSPPNEFEVDDPDRYVQQHRIRSILNARDSVLEARKNAFELLARNRIDAPMACRIVKDTVDGYIRESETKIRDHLPVERYGLDVDPTEIDEEDLESASERAAFVAWFAAPLGAIEPDGPASPREVHGLQEFLNLPLQVTFEYESETRHPVRGLQTEKQTESCPIPMEVSMQAYSILNSFWNTMDMDVTIEKSGLEVEDGFDSLSGNGAGDHRPQL